MSGAFRTGAGGRIDRSRTLRFTFDGETLTGHRGDTLASALLANGRHLAGRSFKYHRPRGILTVGAEEPNALVTVTRGGGRVTPNLRATEVELYDGLTAWSQNRWPSLARDFGAVADRLSPLFAAGFYYKTFMGPRLLGSNWAWTRIYEPLIRRAAGLGRAPGAADPDHYASRFAHCDVLIAGAGPAGLAAALAASESDARVILADEQAEMGGALLSEAEAKIDGKPAAVWVADALMQLRARPRVRLMPRTTVFGAFAQNFLGLAERVTDHLAAPDPDLPRERLWQVRAREVVLATGAIERPLVFPGNDRPGIMLADAARTYLERYGVRPGRRAVVAGCDDGIYRTALALHGQGVAVAAVLDARAEVRGDAVAAARAAGLHVRTGTQPIGTRGRLRIAEVRVGERTDTSLRDAGLIACDCLLMSGGWTPCVHLFSQARGRLRFDAGTQAFLPDRSPEAMRSAGACAGIGPLADVVHSGHAAGAQAAAIAASRTFHVTGVASTAAWPLAAQPIAGAKAFVDFQNDVTVSDLKLAAREGFHAIEHVKRYTTAGMATDQGKTSGMNALAVVAGAVGRPVPAVGLTTFRQPYTPVTFGTLAGPARAELFDPVRCTPIHAWAQAHGAVFEDVGTWKRAQYFPRGGEDMHAAVARECRTVRTSVGIFDATTLGKIEVVGPDAAEFLHRLYVNPIASLGIGRSRYGVMLNEAGFVMDDGVVTRLGPDRFHVTTTTGGAAAVLHRMEDYRQTEWPHLKVWLTSTTEQWAVLAVQGPRAREAIAPLIEGDISPARLPHMAAMQVRAAGIEARLFRVSFTGEAGFEINVPASAGRRVWEAVFARMESLGGCAYGTETMHVLRAEKGYIIVGQETDGTVIPSDLGLPVRKDTRDFVGRRSLSRPDMVRPGRKQLVGLLTSDAGVLLEEGAQITQQQNPPTGTPALGHVTSAYRSAALGRPIALALVAGGRARLGQRLFVPMPGTAHEVEVVSPVFYDPAGARLHG